MPNLRIAIQMQCFLRLLEILTGQHSTAQLQYPKRWEEAIGSPKAVASVGKSKERRIFRITTQRRLQLLF